MLLRPPEYIADVRERELEIRAMERTLGRQERCPYCKSHIEGNYLSCPVCMTKLRHECDGCDKALDPRWVMCPYCETEVPSTRRDLGERRPVAQAGAGTQRAAARQTKPAAKPTRTARASKPATKPRVTRDTTLTAKPIDSTPAKKDEGDTIDTEPFNVSRPARFVRTMDQPTLTGIPKPIGTPNGGGTGPTSEA
jgi:hypothetical protein